MKILPRLYVVEVLVTVDNAERFKAYARFDKPFQALACAKYLSQKHFARITDGDNVLWKS